MKLVFDASELVDDWDRDLDLAVIVRNAVESTTKAFVKKMVQEELDKAAIPVREIIRKRADAMLQAALDEVRDLPDATILDALVRGDA
jgi:rRNA-processing protein FCF1